MAQKYENKSMTPFSMDDNFMKRCIELAQLGNDSTFPNPMVGSVIVHNKKIIGEGYHEKFGEAHAEVNAIKSVKNKDLLKESTIYVSLEPCAHYGKTPPCALLIIESKIPKVVIGMKDPFAKVNGEGIRLLKDAGIDVKVGVMEQDCEKLNKAFNNLHRTKRPYVILKWAQTQDGFIDKIRTKDSEQKPNWITNEACRTLVHKWRSETQAILIGTNTALIDNPKLNVRSWKGNSPIRIVIDKDLKLPNNLHIFDQSIPTIIINNEANRIQENLEYIKLKFDNNLLESLLHVLYTKNIVSVFVEGGKKTLQSFIDQNIYDEARVFVGSTTFEEGLSAPIINEPANQSITIDHSTLNIYINN